MANFFSSPLLLILFLFFSPISSDAATASSLISSIDCGAAKPYTDDLGIPWVTDTSLIKTGSAKAVPDATSYSQPMRTLRVFPTGKSNCYTLSVPGGGQVLVRASFFYGNYDGKNSPPTFDLEFDGNSWTTVETSSDTVVSHEAIYVVSGGSTSVCVVQTKTGEFPFVSALEVRSLDDKMYSRYDRSSSALVLSLRTAVGLPQLVRYPDDPYDRIWVPFQAPNSVDVVQNQATTVDTGIKDSPPVAVFQSAITPASGGNSISITAPLPSDAVRAYINMYFTEVAQLSSGDNRTIQIFVDDVAASDPLFPPFGGVTEFYMSKITASSSTKIDMRPTTDANLPPVISAMEAYVIIPLAGSGGVSGAARVLQDSDVPPSDAPPSDELPSEAPSSDTPPSDTPPSDTPPSDEPPSDTQPSDTPPESDQSTSPPANSAPSNKPKPSFGNKVKVSYIVGIGSGLIFPLLLLNSL